MEITLIFHGMYNDSSCCFREIFWLAGMHASIPLAA